MHQLPHVSGQPINLYNDNSAEEIAFPWLFPNGVNGLHTARNRPISFTDYIESHLLNADNRWSSDIPYLPWSANLLEKMRLHDSVSIAMQIRSLSSLGSTGRITAGELLNGELSENPELSENSYAFMCNICDTSAYWNKAKLDLFAMFKTLYPPTFFITLSADDMKWFDLMCVLAKCDGKSLSDNAVK